MPIEGGPSNTQFSDLSRRDIFKQHRFAALAEWRQLAA